MTLSLLTLLLAVDPCAPVAAATPDPALAAVYVRVAKEEEKQGARAAAASAWSSAASVENGDGEAHRALRRLCVEKKAADDFERALALFSSHNCAEARPLLEAARKTAEHSAASLLDGICALEAREFSRASEALDDAQRDPALAETAQLYLGLLALETGSEDSTPRLRALASGTSSLRSTAAELLRLTEGDRPLMVDAELEGGFDSNAQLIPIPDGDGFASLLANLAARPWGAHGPYFFVGGGYRKYVRIPSTDLGLGTATLGWQLDRRVRASLDYGVDFVSLSAAPWLLRQRGTLRASTRAGPLTVGAEYVLRYDLLFVDSARDYTGLRHAARVNAGLPLGPHQVELAGLFQYSGATTPERAFVEAGAEARAFFELRKSLALLASAAIRWRRFSGVDPDLLVVREEAQFDGSLRADQDLTDALAIFAQLEVRGLGTNAAGIGYWRVAATGGVRLSLGFF